MRHVHHRSETDSHTDEVSPATPSPIGYTRVVGGRLAMIGSIDQDRSGVESLMEDIEKLASNPGVTLFGSARGVPLPPEVDVIPMGFNSDIVDDLREFAGVIDHGGLHESSAERAKMLLHLALAAIPAISLDETEALRSHLGSELAQSLTRTEAEALANPDLRDAHAVHLRRTASRKTSTGLPAVSVVLATNRPEYLNRAVACLERQTYPRLEVTLVLHGDGFDATDPLFDKPARGNSQVVRVPEGVSFGQALNRGVAASSGELVAKMDDDDWYSSDHIWDLVDAMSYSDADLIAKGAEFVYLAELDITIRRMVEGAQTYMNRNVGGGTFLIRREALEQVRGWRNIRRSVDQAMLDDLAKKECTWFRTFGHGYVLNRRATGHTWDAETDYFLDHSESQWRGLELEISLVTDKAHPTGSQSSESSRPTT